MFASGFSWAHLIVPATGLDKLLDSLGASTDNHIVFHAWLGCFVALGFGVLARMGLERAKARPGVEAWFADDRLTPRAIAEGLGDMWLGLMRNLMNREDSRRFFPLIASLFTYIFINNVMGIFPGVLPATDNANTNFGMAVVVFLVFNAVGLLRDPVGYVKHLMGPMLVLAPMLFVLETFSLFVRVGTLTLRLTGNMFGDHTVFTVMSDLVGPAWFVPIPVPFLGLAIFVSFMQAFVFALLTAVYVGMAIPHGHDDHGHGHDGDDHGHGHH